MFVSMCARVVYVNVCIYVSMCVAVGRPQASHPRAHASPAEPQEVGPSTKVHHPSPIMCPRATFHPFSCPQADLEPISGRPCGYPETTQSSCLLPCPHTHLSRFHPESGPFLERALMSTRSASRVAQKHGILWVLSPTKAASRAVASRQVWGAQGVSPLPC